MIKATIFGLLVALFLNGCVGKIVAAPFNAAGEIIETVIP